MMLQNATHRNIFLLAICAIAVPIGCKQVRQAAPENRPLPYVEDKQKDPTLPKTPTTQRPSKVMDFDRIKFFDSRKEAYKNWTWEQLKKRWKLDQEKAPTKLSFRPSQAKYYKQVVRKLRLTTAEKKTLEARGFVKVDHKRAYSMGALYYSVYTSDLPVLITTDSILHAIHRSYDASLKELEQTVLHWQIATTLKKTQAHAAAAHLNAPESIKPALRDIDLMMTVGLNLLKGHWKARIPSQLNNKAQVNRILKKIKSLQLSSPQSGGKIKLYGTRRFIDFSQFRPRGHYTETRFLKRYFRCMMWLGRADTGFSLKPVPQSKDKYYGLRLSATLVHIMEKAGTIPILKSADHIISFMVGKSDNLTVFALQKLLADSKLRTLAQLGSQKGIQTLLKSVMKAEAGRQQIRSQVLLAHPDSKKTTPIPSLFHLFGQRFVLDSFVFSNVVFDSILFRGRKQMRMMPKGLDVMAALGNNTAGALLQPELKKFQYSANLLASRDVVDRHPLGWWRQNLYNIWLQSLRQLTKPPSRGYVPEVMKTRAWKYKMLETQLASWAELRHDTILYAKQSYTAYPTCVYPTGYVEPYPAFYLSLERFAKEASTRIAGIRLDGLPKRVRWRLRRVQKAQSRFYKRAANTLARLRSLAIKELKAIPFSGSDKSFIKKTLDVRGGGSGPPRYDGWWPKLIYGGSPSKWNPTVADVHTDPKSGKVLQVAVGNAHFLIAAIDNNGDKMIYVGPAYSYYEFHHPATDRLTDGKWQRILLSKPPTRPSWTDSYTQPGKKRHPTRH